MTRESAPKGASQDGRQARSDGDDTPKLHRSKDSIANIWTKSIFHLSTLTTSERIVALAVGSFVDYRNGDGAHPGISKLERMTGLDRSTITRALRRLRGLPLKRDDGEREDPDRRWLTRASRGSSGGKDGGTASVYNLWIPLEGRCTVHRCRCTEHLPWVHSAPPSSLDPPRSSRFVGAQNTYPGYERVGAGFLDESTGVVLTEDQVLESLEGVA